MSTVISKEELIEAGYPKATAQGIIREANCLSIKNTLHHLLT